MPDYYKGSNPVKKTVIYGSNVPELELAVDQEVDGGDFLKIAMSKQKEYSYVYAAANKKYPIYTIVSKPNFPLKDGAELTEFTIKKQNNNNEEPPTEVITCKRDGCVLGVPIDPEAMDVLNKLYGKSQQLVVKKCGNLETALDLIEKYKSVTTTFNLKFSENALDEILKSCTPENKDKLKAFIRKYGDEHTLSRKLT